MAAYSGLNRFILGATIPHILSGCKQDLAGPIMPHSRMVGTARRAVRGWLLQERSPRRDDPGAWTFLRGIKSQSQRDCIIQPRVATCRADLSRHSFSEGGSAAKAGRELPWVHEPNGSINPERVASIPHVTVRQIPVYIGATVHETRLEMKPCHGGPAVPRYISAPLRFVRNQWRKSRSRSARQSH